MPLFHEIIKQSSDENQTPHLVSDGEFQGNPVLVRSGLNFETDEIRNPAIRKFDETRWIQFYIARSIANGREGATFGLSLDSDKHNWTKNNDLILASRPASWDDQISGLAPIMRNGKFYILYGSWNVGKIGLAIWDPNEPTAVRYSDSPIIDHTADDNFDKYLRHPCVEEHQGIYYLTCETRISPDEVEGVGFKNSNLTYLTSTDLINWTRSGVPMFDNTLWNTYYYTMGMPTKRFFQGKWHMFMIATYVKTGISITGGGILYAVGDTLDAMEVVSHNIWALPKREREGSWNAGNNQEPELWLIDEDNLYLYVNGRTDLAAIGMGFYNLRLGKFNDVLPDRLISEDFTGISKPSNWTYTEEMGITVTQNDGLIIDADGLQDSAPIIAVQCDDEIVNFNQIAFAFAFNWNVVPVNSLAELSFEISNSDRSTGLFIKRNNTIGTITGKIIVNNIQLASWNTSIANGTLVKFAKDGEQAGFFKENVGLFDFVDTAIDIVFGKTSLKFKVVIENKLGESTQVILPKVVAIPFDYPTTKTFI